MGGPALINEKYYNEFDNFFICSFSENGIQYISTEHYYQSKKVLDPKIQQIISSAKNAYEAYSLGQMYPLRKGWDNMKVEIMLYANKLKFDQNPSLKKILVDTEGEIEFPYSDSFWGSGDVNMLGKILMILRAYYKNENRSFFELQKNFNFHIDWH